MKGHFRTISTSLSHKFDCWTFLPGSPKIFRHSTTLWWITWNPIQTSPQIPPKLMILTHPQLWGMQNQNSLICRARKNLNYIPKCRECYYRDDEWEKYILMNYEQQMRTVNFEWDLLNNKLTKNIPQKITCEILLSFSLSAEKIFQFFSIIFIVPNYFFCCTRMDLIFQTWKGTRDSPLLFRASI
jgi:hypothetical protein